MKIRNGFISNSSSSNFVICGFKISENSTVDYVDVYKKLTKHTDEDIHREIKRCSSKWEKNVDYIPSKSEIRDFCNDMLYSGSINEIDFEMGEGVDGIIVGKKLCSFDGDYAEQNDVDILEVVDDVMKIRDQFGINAPIKVYSGTRGC